MALILDDFIVLCFALITGAGAAGALFGVVYVTYITFSEVIGWFKGKISTKQTKGIQKINISVLKSGKYSIRQVVRNGDNIKGREVIADEVDQKLKKILKNEGGKYYET